MENPIPACQCVGKETSEACCICHNIITFLDVEIDDPLCPNEGHFTSTIKGCYGKMKRDFFCTKCKLSGWQSTKGEGGAIYRFNELTKQQLDENFKELIEFIIQYDRTQRKERWIWETSIKEMKKDCFGMCCLEEHQFDLVLPRRKIKLNDQLTLQDYKDILELDKYIIRIVEK